MAEKLQLTDAALAKVRGSSPSQTWAFVCSSRRKNAVVVDAFVSYDSAKRAAKAISGVMRVGVVDGGAASILEKPSKAKSKPVAQLNREIVEVTESKQERFNTDQEEDNRPGFYYVTAIDGPRKARIAGPYKTHGTALDKVRTVKDRAEDVDPRAHWWAWGTMRSETDLGPGSLGVV